MEHLRDVLRECEHRGVPIPGGIDKTLAGVDDKNIRVMAKQLRKWQVLSHGHAPNRMCSHGYEDNQL